MSTVNVPRGPGLFEVLRANGDRVVTSPPPPRRNLDREMYAAHLADLAAWIEAFLAAYPSAAAAVRPCWTDHKDAVTELGLIWCEFTRIYTAEHPSLDDALIFHDRWLPGVLKRVHQITAQCATGCVLSRPAREELIPRRTAWTS